MKNKLVIFLIVSMNLGHAQIGDVIWEDNFDNLDNWMKITGNGSWGWGNGELEFYQEENLEIDEVPDDLINALLQMEDQDFYNHSGFSFKSTFRAIIIDIFRYVNSLKSVFLTLITINIANISFALGGVITLIGLRKFIDSKIYIYSRNKEK